MKIEINNITFNFIKIGSDHLPDEDNLGLAHLIMPGNMSKRFTRECGYKRGHETVMPHYDTDDMMDVNFGSDHNCYNSDTQIVLIKYLFDKQRKYKLEYQGLDPYWLFHDSFHAENDVYGYEVSGINSYVESQRLFEGAEFSKSKGIFIKPETVAKLEGAWSRRWRFQENNSFKSLDVREFYPYMSSQRAINQLDRYLEFGTFSNNN